MASQGMATATATAGTAMGTTTMGRTRMLHAHRTIIVTVEMVLAVLPRVSTSHTPPATRVDLGLVNHITFVCKG